MYELMKNHHHICMLVISYTSTGKWYVVYILTDLGEHCLLEVGFLEVCVHKQSPSQCLAAEVCLGQLALPQVELLVTDGVGLADGVAHVGTFAAIWVCVVH